MEAQERVLAWWRVKHTPPAKAPTKPRKGDSIDQAARAFWGLGGGK